MACKFITQHLDRNLSIQGSLMRLIHNTGAPSAQSAYDAVIDFLGYHVNQLSQSSHGDKAFVDLADGASLGSAIKSNVSDAE